MTIITDAFTEYEFNNKFDYVRYIEQKCFNIKRSLRFVEMDTEHLKVRCPVSGEYIDVVGTEEEINWIHSVLTRHNMYRLN